MSKIQMPTLLIESVLTSSDISPIKTRSSMQMIESARPSKFKDNDNKLQLFPLPEIQIKKSRTLLPPTIDSDRKSPFKSDSTKLKITSSDCVYKTTNKKKKKSVYIPEERFVEIVEIESFKRYNFIEQVTAKEYDVFNKRCCNIF